MGKSKEVLRGAEIFIRALKDEGIKHLFGYPGGAVLHIYDALYKQEDVEHILVRHEQGPGTRCLLARSSQIAISVSTARKGVSKPTSLAL